MAIRFLDEQPKTKKVKFIDESPVEQKISERKSYVQALGKQVKDGGVDLGVMSPTAAGASLETMKQTGELGLNLIGTYGQLTEAPFANIALDLQQEGISEFATGGVTGVIGKTGKVIKEGITGERLGEYGDIYRNLGMPEPVAATLGLITASVLDPTQIKKIPFEGVDVSTKKIGRIIKKKRLFTEGGQPKVNFRERGRRILENIKGRFLNEGERVKLEGDLAINKIQKETDTLLQQFDEVAGMDARKVQEGLIDLQKKNSEIYGNYIKAINRRLNKSNTMLRANEIESVTGDIVNKIASDGADGTKSMDSVINFLDKYTTGAKGTLRSNKAINLDDLLDDFRKVKGNIQVDINTGQLTPDSRAAQIFKSNMNDFLESRIPGWKDLNLKYSKVKDLSKKAGTIFQQGKGKYYTKKGEEFLKSTAEEAILTGERAVFVDDLEKGIAGFADGLGDVTKRERHIARKIAENKASVADIKELNMMRRRDVARKGREIVERAKTKKYGIYGATTLQKAKQANIVKTAAKRIAQIGITVMLYDLIRNDMRNVLSNDSGGSSNQSN